MISAAKPNKTDDGIVAIVKRWVVPVTIPAGPLTDADRGSLLLQTAITAATKEVAGASGVPVSVLATAIQIAYTVAKAARGKMMREHIVTIALILLVAAPKPHPRCDGDDVLPHHLTRS